MKPKLFYRSLSYSRRLSKIQRSEKVQNKNILNIHSIKENKPFFRIVNRAKRRIKKNFIYSWKRGIRVREKQLLWVTSNKEFPLKKKRAIISYINQTYKEDWNFDKPLLAKRMVAKNPSKRFFVNYNLQDGKEIASKKYKKFIGLLTKNGNRVKAENILKSAFLKLYQRTGMSYFWFLPRVLNKLSNYFEIKKVVRSKKKKKKKKNKKESFNLVPFPLNTTRQFFYTLKWINEGAKMSTRKVDFAEKLSREIFSIIFRRAKSKALYKQKQLRKQAIENKSNGHYRW